MCASNESWTKIVKGRTSNWVVTFDRYSHKNRGVQCDFSCDCPSYQYGKGKYCKHIEQVKGLHCGWHQQYHGGEAKDGKCPECGGETVVIKVAV